MCMSEGLWFYILYILLFWGTGVFTLWYIAAKLNSLALYVGQWPRTIQFSAVTFNPTLPLLVGRWWFGSGESTHFVDAFGSSWKLRRMRIYYLMILSFALWPLQIAKW